MTTDVPTGPDVGFRLVIFGVEMIVKGTPLLATPPTVTMTLPVVVTGTVTEMLVGLQLVGVATSPLNMTVLIPCLAPKFVPLMVTDVPARPDVGFRPVTFGVGRTVKAIPLLDTPAIVAITLPVDAPGGTRMVTLVVLQLTGTAIVPFNVIVLVP